MADASRELKQCVNLWRNIDRLHRLPRRLADALDGNLPRRDFRVSLRDDAFVPDRARVLADNPQVDFELVFKPQGPVELERRLDPRPTDACAASNTEPGLAPHRMLGFFEIAEEPAEMHDARHVG